MKGLVFILNTFGSGWGKIILHIAVPREIDSQAVRVILWEMHLPHHPLSFLDVRDDSLEVLTKLLPKLVGVFRETSK